jgi:hypothetical protein
MRFFFLAQDAPAAPEYNFWNGAPGSSDLLLKVLLGFLLGVGIIVALMYAPTRLRRPLIAIATFIAGGFWMAWTFWPKAPEGMKEGETFSQNVAIFLSDVTSVVSTFTQVLTAFLLGLGVYSVISVHGKKILKQQKDWQFSAILFLSAILMVVFGYGDWLDEQKRSAAETALNPGFWNRGKDLLFDGLLQNMDAAMFSLIAFFILSAAYRAFRIRSVESTILLSTALIVMLSLMGVVVSGWDNLTGSLWGGNLSLTEISKFINANLQTPGIQAVKFGLGIATLAMAMRIWLSLERGGLNS